MYIGTYLSTIRGLMDQRRYQNLFLLKKRSVAEHSWSVAKICQALAYLEKHKFGHEVDMGLLLQLAITHDELELITGDILSNTKRRTPAMRHAVDEMEKVVFDEEYRKILPINWEEDFRRFTLEAKDESIEGKLLHAADCIDALLEAVDEVELGNTKYFLKVMQSQAEKLLTIDLDSVRHFIKHSLADFGLDIRKYYGYEVYQAVQALKAGDDTEEQSYVPFEDVMELMKATKHSEWIVLHDENKTEVMRFRNKSLQSVEVIRDGKHIDVKRKSFEIPATALLTGYWLIVQEKSLVGSLN